MYPGQYELQVQVYIRDRGPNGSGSIGFTQTEEINAASFADVAKILSKLNEVIDVIKKEQPEVVMASHERTRSNR